MTKQEAKKEYLQNYKKFHYSKTRKIVTIPLLIEDYALLEERAIKSQIKANTMAKNILISYLADNPVSYMTMTQKELLKEYMRISRGIANNINQLSRSSNLGERVDVNLLITSLKHYEDEFKFVITKLEQ